MVINSYHWRVFFTFKHC